MPIEEELDVMLDVIRAERERASSTAQSPDDDASCVSGSGSLSRSAPVIAEDSNRRSDVLDELRIMERRSAISVLSLPPVKTLSKQRVAKGYQTKTRCCQ